LTINKKVWFMNNLALIGSKAMAHGIKDMVELYHLYNVIGYFDDFAEKGSVVEGKPVLGNTDDCINMYHEGIFDFIFIASGYNSFEGREKLYLKYKGIIPFANIISPTAFVHPSARIGEGVLLSDGAYINRDAVIEDNVAITLRSIVNHGGHVKKHTFFSTGVVTAGNVIIGERCFIGVGSVISDGVSICDDVWLTPGSIVIKDIKKPGHYLSQSSKLFNIG